MNCFEEMKERVGKRFADLAGYDVDGLIGDAEYYAAAYHEEKKRFFEFRYRSLQDETRYIVEIRDLKERIKLRGVTIFLLSFIATSLLIMMILT